LIATQWRFRECGILHSKTQKTTKSGILAAIAYPASSLLILVFALPHRLKTPKNTPKTCLKIDLNHSKTGSKL
jgi:hypothetical protein